MELLKLAHEHVSEIGAYAFSFVLIGGYHLYLRSKLRRDRSYTIQSVSNHARAAWVENVMTDKSWGILGVQTLRNSTMAATFLASTAVLLIMGVLNLMRGGNADSIMHSLETGVIAGGTMEEVKLLLLLSTFFTAFFSFSLAVRLYNHVGYLLNSTNSKCQFCPTTGYVSRLLNRSAAYYSFGMRAYYISVPLVFGLFSPVYMVMGSLVLVMVLHHIDRTPDTRAGDGDILSRKSMSRFRLKPTAQEETDAGGELGVVNNAVNPPFNCGDNPLND